MLFPFQLSTSLHMLTVQIEKIEILQTELTKVEQLKVDLESARKYNITLVNQKAEEKKKATEDLSAFEAKAAELEKANAEKVTAKKRVEALVREKKKLSEEIAALKKENEQISAQRDEANNSAEDATSSLEELLGQDTKTVIMKKWFDSKQCKLRGAYLGEQMRYWMMDLAVECILKKYPHLDVSDIDLKMNLDDVYKKSYFYKMDPAPKQFHYEHTLDFTYPEDESADEDEDEEEEVGCGEEDGDRETRAADGTEDFEAPLERPETSPGAYADLENTVPVSDMVLASLDTPPPATQP